MGNHDGEGFFDNEKMGEVYRSGKHSLFTPGPANIQGCGNYGINIVEGGNIVYALIMIDSNRYRGIGYDYIYPAQIAWYEWYIRGVGAVKSLAFFHIPLPEINDARKDMKRTDPAGAAIAFRQNPSPPSENTGMFQKMKDLDSTTHMFFGHDHVNRVDYKYQGIHFVYGLKTGPCSYYDADRQGTTLITIQDDLTVTVEFKDAGR
jgi:hypothetical protein